MNVLIIDDARVMRNIHKNVLLEFRINEDHIFEAGDGLVALKIAREKHIDLFLVDWNIPGINGLEFVKKIRNMEKYKDSHIIMITSEAAKYMVIDAIKAGVTNYIVKPIRRDVLTDKLASYVNV